MLLPLLTSLLFSYSIAFTAAWREKGESDYWAFVKFSCLLVAPRPGDLVAGRGYTSMVAGRGRSVVGRL